MNVFSIATVLASSAYGPWCRLAMASGAADVLGEARGELAGNVLRWRYQLKLDVDGTTWNVDFDV